MIKDTEKLFNTLKHTQLQKCCENYCRDWHETKGWLPASNHSPTCINYKTEAFFKVSVKGEKGQSCIFETQEEVDAFCEPPEKYDVSVIEITRDQFEHLDEFQGF